MAPVEFKSGDLEVKVTDVQSTLKVFTGKRNGRHQFSTIPLKNGQTSVGEFPSILRDASSVAANRIPYDVSNLNQKRQNEKMVDGAIEEIISKSPASQILRILTKKRG